MQTLEVDQSGGLECRPGHSLNAPHTAPPLLPSVAAARQVEEEMAELRQVNKQLIK